MSNDWYSKQFGERDEFAIIISFCHDPEPTGERTFDAAWGGLAIWVHGKCLTQSISSIASSSGEVRWSLHGILDWLTRVGVRLVNEEPFPVAPSGRVRDACDWYNATDSAPVVLDAAEERAFFLARSEWWQNHGLRGSALEAALPNISFRRFGESLEVSWDNETWGSPQSKLSYVERRGAELVPASIVAAVLLKALVDATSALEQRTGLPAFHELAAAARNARATEGDWQWLIHRPTAELIRSDLPSLAKALDQRAKETGRGLFVPHSAETLVLRQVRLNSTAEIEALLEATRHHHDLQMSALAQSLIHPQSPSSREPYRDGYDRALQTRESLGWGNEPAPDLREWMNGNGISIRSKALPCSVDLVSIRTEDFRGTAVLNSQAQRLRYETYPAIALGHIVCDEEVTVVEGSWGRWATSARAKAYAAMLLLPVDGIRRELENPQQVEVADVRRIMDRFGTGAYLTTNHLNNLGFISDEKRMELVHGLPLAA